MSEVKIKSGKGVLISATITRGPDSVTIERPETMPSEDFVAIVHDIADAVLRSPRPTSTRTD